MCVCVVLVFPTSDQLQMLFRSGSHRLIVCFAGSLVRITVTAALLRIAERGPRSSNHARHQIQARGTTRNQGTESRLLSALRPRRNFGRNFGKFDGKFFGSASRLWLNFDRKLPRCVAPSHAAAVWPVCVATWRYRERWYVVFFSASFLWCLRSFCFGISFGF